LDSIISRSFSLKQWGSYGYIPKSNTSGLIHFSNITTGTTLEDFRDRFRDREIDPIKSYFKWINHEFMEVERGFVVFKHILIVH
jgi:hypothetical protein